MPGQHLGGLLAHVADAKGIKHPLQGIFLALFQLGQQIFRRFVPHSFQGGHILLFQEVQIGLGTDQPIS